MNNKLTIPKEFVAALNAFEDNTFKKWVDAMKLSRINNTHGFDSDEKQIEELQYKFNNHYSYSYIIRLSFRWADTGEINFWRDLYFMLEEKGL